MKISNDVASERFLLSSLAQYGSNVYQNVSDILSTDCFSDNNKYIYNVLKTGLDKFDKIDIVSFMSIAADLKYDNILNTKTQLAFVKSLFNSHVIKENSLEYAIKIRKIHLIKCMQETMMAQFEKLGQYNGNEDINEILYQAEVPFNDISTSLNIETNKPELLMADSTEYFEYIEENPNTVPYIPSGFDYYDSATGGIRKGYLSLIVARPKAGKSNFLLRVARNIACDNNIPVLYLDTEMKKDLQLNRLLSGETGIKYSEIETGKFANSPKKNLLYSFTNNMKDKPFYYMTIAGKPFDEILNIIKRWANVEVGRENGEYKDCVIIYDYFKLMSTNDISNLSEHAAIGYQLSNLTTFLTQTNIACISAVQANRDGIDQEGTNIVSGSDRIVWFTSSLCLLRKKTVEEIHEEGITSGNRKLIPMDAMRFSEGLAPGSWIDLNCDNFNITEIGIGHK